MGFPGSSAGKESTCNVGDLGLILGLGRSPGEGKDYPLQYSGLESSRDYIVHGVTKSQTRLSDFHLKITLKNLPFSDFTTGNNSVLKKTILIFFCFVLILFDKLDALWHLSLW